MPRVSITEGGSRRELEFERTLTIGRDAACDLILSSESVSRYHALIRCQEGEYVLLDLGSSNGTYLNGRPIGVPHHLRSGDELEVGGIRLRFFNEAPVEPSPALSWPAGAAKTARRFTPRQACILVSDIRDFTQMSAAVPGDVLPPILTRWFRLMGKMIEGHDGTIEKFRGDSVMAYWVQAPGRTRNAVVARALEAAGAIVVRADAFAREVAGQLGESGFRVGCGLHLGTAVLGNIGADSRRDITMLGDCVNIAFRIQGLCGPLGQPILLSREVHDAAVGDFVFDALGDHEIKGKDDPLELFAMRLEAD